MTGRRTAWDELSRREAEVLAAVERRLNNAEIAEELFVSVRTVESHIAALRRKLGVDSRAGLMEAARARRGTTVQLPRNSFVGRAADVATVRSLLDADRWVTVVGPAGAGKTRLALEVAAAAADHAAGSGAAGRAGPDAADRARGRVARAPVVAELEGAGPGDVAGIVAQALGLGADSAGDPIAACGVALAAQPYLLVVDNCDRVTRDVGPVVARLLALAPSLAVLATSRTPVGAPDETVLPLAPLPVTGDAAVRLFLDRARTAAPGAGLSEDDAALVARVCERLDGLPLAIELAAARVRHLPLPELADRLDGDLSLLARDGRDDRHSTLDAALAWTWDLLAPDERRVLAQLAALPRSVDLELAAAVAGEDAGRVVLRLLDRSLLAQTPTVTTPRRFRLLHPVREFVLGRTDPDLVDAARRAHAAHHAEAAAALAGRVRTDDGRELAAEADRRAPDIAAALRWATAADPALAAALARSLAVIAEHCGPRLDGLEAVARAARTPAVREAATGDALYLMGEVLCYGDVSRVDDLAAWALDHATDDASRLAAHHLAGHADAYGRRTASAERHLAEAERLATAQGETWALAAARQARGVALRYADRPEAALDAFTTAMRTFALAGDAMHVNNVRYMMAATAADAGLRTGEAIGWCDECVAYATRTGNAHELAHAQLTRAALTATTEALPEAVATFRSAGDLRCLARCHLLRARLTPSPADRVPALDEALAVATGANDRAHQAAALGALVDAHWSAGDAYAAAVALGHLTALVGEEPALAQAPDAMRARLAGLTPALAEGRARAAR